MRDRGDITDAGDIQPRALQRTDGGFAAATRARYVHFHLPETVSHCLLGGITGGHLRRIGRALARALEAGRPGRRPGNDVALGVSQRDDGIVEGRLNVRRTFRNIFLFLLALKYRKPEQYLIRCINYSRNHLIKRII